MLVSSRKGLPPSEGGLKASTVCLYYMGRVTGPEIQKIPGEVLSYLRVRYPTS